MIRIAQINMDRARGVTAEVREIANRMKVDVLLLQEPYVWSQRVIGFGIKSRVIVHEGEGRPWAAVVVMNESIGAMRIQDLCNTHCTCVELLLPDRKRMYVCSVYCQFSRGIDEYLEMLRVIRRRLRGKWCWSEWTRTLVRSYGGEIVGTSVV